MEIDLFSFDQFGSYFLHLFQCMRKCVGRYNTAIAQSCSGAQNNLEIADSINVDKWHLNECKKVWQTVYSYERMGIIMCWLYVHLTMIPIAFPWTPFLNVSLYTEWEEDLLVCAKVTTLFLGFL